MDQLLPSVILSLICLCLIDPTYNSIIHQTLDNSASLQCSATDSVKKGVCIFAIECLRLSGHPLSLCIDKLFVKSCCALSSNIRLNPNTSHYEDNALETFADNLPLDFLPRLTNETTNKTEQETVNALASFVNKIQSIEPVDGGRNDYLMGHTPDDVVDATNNSEYIKLENFTETTPNFVNESRLNDNHNEIPNISFVFHHSSEDGNESEWYSVNISEINLFPYSPSSEASLFSEDFKTENFSTQDISTVTKIHEEFNTFTLDTNWSKYFAKETYAFDGEQFESTFPTTLLDEGNVFSSETNHSMTDLTFDTTFQGVCGKQFHRYFPQGRVRGGKSSMFAKWPWQASIRVKKKNIYTHSCGGALLNEFWVVTAAHCVHNKSPKDLVLRLGEFDLSREDEPLPHVDKAIKEIYPHKQYSERTFQNDIALLRMSYPTVFKKNIIPVCLPEKADDEISPTAFVTGWGQLYAYGPYPNVLHEVEIPIISNEECQLMLQRSILLSWSISKSVICAVSPNGGKDACEGDSGGPVVVKRSNERWEIIGIVSWGVDCGQPDIPGAYTRISSFLDWILPIINQ